MKDGFVKAAAATPDIRVADVAYNTENICKMIDETVANGAKVIVFPELCVTGYTCSDLFMQDILLVETAREHHNTSPVATAALGRLLTAGAMMGSMMKNETDMLTLQVRGDGPLGGITVTADSKGDVKGYVNNPDVMLPPKNGKLDVGGAVGIGLLQVIKDMGLRNHIPDRQFLYPVR